MAQDYHIYIHGDSSNFNGGGNQTKPFSAKEETGFSGQEIAGKAFQTASTIASGNAVSSGAAALGKIMPLVAITIAAIKVYDKIITTGLSHVEEYTGNYKWNVDYNNFKTQLNNTIHPIRHFLSVKHQEAQFNKQNKEIAQQNRLIGNSILKDFNIGV